jgi:hypothetical protein
MQVHVVSFVIISNKNDYAVLFRGSIGGSSRKHRRNRTLRAASPEPTNQAIPVPASRLITVGSDQEHSCIFSSSALTQVMVRTRRNAMEETVSSRSALGRGRVAAVCREEVPAFTVSPPYQEGSQSSTDFHRLHREETPHARTSALSSRASARFVNGSDLV